MHGFKSETIVVALLLALGLLGCRTTPIREPDVIRVPAGLTTTQVEMSIASAIEYSTLRGGWKVGSKGRVLPEDDEQVPVWYVEARNPGAIGVACKKNDHSLRAVIRYNAHEVRVEIIGSENLLQSETRIHENAYTWIADLEFWIRNELGKTVMRTG